MLAVKRSALEDVDDLVAAGRLVELGDGGTHLLYRTEASAGAVD